MEPETLAERTPTWSGPMETKGSEDALMREAGRQGSQWDLQSRTGSGSSPGEQAPAR